MTTAPERGAGGIRAAAFFDMHGTAVPAAAHVPLAAAALKSGLMSPQSMLSDMRYGLVYTLKGLGDERTERIRDQFLAALRGRSQAEFEAIVADVAPTLASTVNSAMRSLLDEQIIAGRERVLLSASPSELVVAVAAALGLEGAAGTVAEVDEVGRYTGGYVGTYCFGEGKAEALRRIAQERGYDLAASYAYSDSVSDLPMLEAVGHPVAVNPDPSLRAVAEDRRWPILQTSRFQRITLTDPNSWSRMGQRLLVAGVAALVSMGTRPVEYFGELFDTDDEDEIAMAG